LVRFDNDRDVGLNILDLYLCVRDDGPRWICDAPIDTREFGLSIKGDRSQWTNKAEDNGEEEPTGGGERNKTTERIAKVRHGHCEIPL
jgi:hypothetical protein